MTHSEGKSVGTNDHVTAISWRKSSWSAYNGNCVEVAELCNGVIGVRDTKDKGTGPVLMVSAGAWREFIRELKEVKTTI